MTVFVSSDHHLGHTRICELANRPWGSVDEMNTALIENHNTMVRPDDEVIIVGDIVMGRRADNLPMVGLMNGRKTLIVGNHDPMFPGEKQGVTAEKWREHYLDYFTSTIPWMTVVVPSSPTAIEFCHFPYRPDEYDHHRDGTGDRWADARVVDTGRWLCHGHTHNPSMFSGPRQLHIGVDADWTAYGVPRYSPIPLDTIVDVIRGLER